MAAACDMSDTAWHWRCELQRLLAWSAPPLLLSHTEVGLFGLAGLAGIDLSVMTL